MKSEILLFVGVILILTFGMLTAFKYVSSQKVEKGRVLAEKKVESDSL